MYQITGYSTAHAQVNNIAHERAAQVGVRIAREKSVSVALMNRLVQVAHEKSVNVYLSQLRCSTPTMQLR